MGFDIFFNDSNFDPESRFRNKLLKSSIMKTLLLKEKLNRENRNENNDRNNNDGDLLVQGEDEKRVENKNPSPPPWENQLTNWSLLPPPPSLIIMVMAKMMSTMMLMGMANMMPANVGSTSCYSRNKESTILRVLILI